MKFIINYLLVLNYVVEFKKQFIINLKYTLDQHFMLIAFKTDFKIKTRILIYIFYFILH